MVNNIAVTRIRIRVRSEIKEACVPRNPGRLSKLPITSPDHDQTLPNERQQLQQLWNKQKGNI
jgi:3'-phosphoadenosine 5'-phosphosulfate sulfotransferase